MIGCVNTLGGLRFSLRFVSTNNCDCDSLVFVCIVDLLASLLRAYSRVVGLVTELTTEEDTEGRVRGLVRQVFSLVINSGLPTAQLVVSTYFLTGRSCLVCAHGFAGSK